MRKTGQYGGGDAFNIEWPTAIDILLRANNIPIKIKDLKYQESTEDSKLFGAFQVILSNGISSPVLNQRTSMPNKCSLSTFQTTLSSKRLMELNKVNVI